MTRADPERPPDIVRVTHISGETAMTETPASDDNAEGAQPPAEGAPPPQDPVQQPLPPGQSYPVQYVMAVPVTEPKGKRGMSIAGMVLGIVAVVLFWLAGVSLLLAIIGLVLSIIGLRKEPGGSGMAIAGIVLNLVAFVLVIVFMTVLAATLNG